MRNDQTPDTPRSRTTKELAQRLDPRYFRSPSKGESLKRILIWAAWGVAGVTAIALTLGAGTTRNALSPGPLSSHHALIANRCEACHADAFTRIPDAACLQCHDGAAHPAKSIDRGKPDRMQACTECHVEHRGDTQLTRVADGTCTACHGSLASHASNVQMKSLNITGFRPGLHPEFSAASRPDLRPLRLDHAKHMPKKAETVGGIHLPMRCADCHASDPNSGKMIPVTFEANCRSCHARELEFDVYRLLKTSTPSPHTKDPATIHQFIVNTYRKLLEADPGVAQRPLGNDVAAQANSAAWMEKVVSSSEQYLFRRPAGPGAQGKCVYCHEVSTGENGFPLVTRVNAIQGRFVSGRPEGEPWLLRGEFNHRMHRSVACESCHTMARESVKTSDILIPVRKSCLPCHGGSRAGLDRCSECHLYHNRSLEHEKGRPTEQILSSVMGGVSVKEAENR